MSSDSDGSSDPFAPRRGLAGRCHLEAGYDARELDGQVLSRSEACLSNPRGVKT
jgi:hypothetical protein